MKHYPPLNLSQRVYFEINRGTAAEHCARLFKGGEAFEVAIKTTAIDGGAAVAKEMENNFGRFGRGGETTPRARARGG